MKTNPFRSIGADFPASIVVLLVAIPLCLGIALGSNAHCSSGLIAGIVGGVVIRDLKWFSAEWQVGLPV